MSYRPMVHVQGEWAGNALRFATEAEALESANNLMMRWMLVTDTRVDASDDPVKHTLIDGVLGYVAP
jgi:hypothetical protein